jgi:hypothetical protein
MTFKPMTYLVSFTLFVLLFMVLGGYVGYSKLADHFLTQGYLDALPINSHVQTDPQGRVLCWEDQVLLEQGASARIAASNRSMPISIHYSDEPEPMVQPSPRETLIPLDANERTEDIRVDRASRYLYARVYATSNIKSKETTWLYKFDLKGRRFLRRTSVNPILLPAPFRP